MVFVEDGLCLWEYCDGEFLACLASVGGVDALCVDVGRAEGGEVGVGEAGVCLEDEEVADLVE